MTTHECVHLVTSSYYWLRNKDGNHAIRLAIAETKTATEVLLLFFFCVLHMISAWIARDRTIPVLGVKFPYLSPLPLAAFVKKQGENFGLTQSQIQMHFSILIYRHFILL